MKFIKKYSRLVLLITSAAFSFWLMFSTFGYHHGSFIIDSKLYSDFAASLPLIRSFSLGDNFPPEYPFFHGQPIRYHYLFYLVVGLMERAGINLAFALNLLSALGFWFLLMMIYKLTKLFSQRLDAAVLAVVLFLFNGSFSWIEYFNKFGWSVKSFLAIPRQIQFASFGPWSGRLVTAFWSLNIYTNQRHLAFSYGLVLWLIYLMIKTIDFRAKKKSQQLLAMHLEPLPLWKQGAIILVLALFPLLHQAGYVMAIIFLLSWLGFYVNFYWRFWRQSLRFLAPFIIGFLFSLLIFRFCTVGSEQKIVWQLGYLAPTKTLLGWLKFYWFNFGLYLPLLPILIIYSLKKKNYFLIIFSSYFLLANIFRLSPDMINNHKLITMFMVGLNIMTAGWLVEKTTTILAGRKVRLLKNLQLSVLVLLTVGLMLGGLVDIWPIINDYNGRVKDYPQSPVMQLIMKKIPKKAQFLTTSYLYNPASLTGRQLFLDYGYFAWSMGYNDRDKRASLRLLFSPTIDLGSWCSLIKKYQINDVLIGPGENKLEDGRINISHSWLVNQLKPTYKTSDGWRLWEINDVCKK